MSHDATHRHRKKLLTPKSRRALVGVSYYQSKQWEAIGKFARGSKNIEVLKIDCGWN